MRGLGRVAIAGLLGGAALLAFLCFVWPVQTVLWEALAVEDWDIARLSGRQLGLLGRGCAIAGAAMLLAQILGAGLAAGLVGPPGSWLRRAAAWTALVVLLTPPYVYAYVWSLIVLPGGSAVGAAGALRLPGWLAHEGRAAWCLGTWTAPAAAFVLAAGWRAGARAAYRLARLDGNAEQAFVQAALRAVLPWLAVSLLITGALALTEHTVCDLSQAPTWNTEILAILLLADAPAALLGWPLAAMMLLILAGLYAFRRQLRTLMRELAGFREVEQAAGDSALPGRRAQTLVTLGAISVLLLPILLLVASLDDPAALRRTWLSFPREWPHGLRYGAGSAVVGVWLALGIDYALVAAQRGRRFTRAAAGLLIALALLAAVAPPALVGDAFAAAYARWPRLADHWWIVSLVTAARFAIIPILSLRIAGSAADGDLSRMALADGATPPAAWFRVRLPLCGPAVGASAIVAGVLAFTEVPASFLVRPPGVESVALRLFNDIHYGRSAEIGALALYLVTFVVGVVTLLLAFRRLARKQAFVGR